MISVLKNNYEDSTVGSVGLRALSISFITGDKTKFNSLKGCGANSHLNSIHMHLNDGKPRVYTELQGEVYDCYIVDIQKMKHLSKELINSIRRDNHNAPVILLEDKLTNESFFRVDELGADGCMAMDGVTPLLLDNVLMSSMRQRRLSLISQETLSGISYLSHEVNTTLCSILGFSELMMSAGSEFGINDKSQSYIRHIHSGGGYIASTIKHIQLLARVETGTYEFNGSNLNLNSVIEGCKDKLAHRSNLRQAKVNNDVLPNAPLLFADPVLISHLIETLVSNVTNKSDGNEITITSHLDDHNAMTIRISGVGVEDTEEFDEFKPENDDLFWQTVVEQNCGSGLDLPISFSIMRAHNGSISVEKIKNQNLTINLKFPSYKTSP